MLVLGRGWALVNPAAPTFRDVPASNPFYPFVETAYQHGAISGYACGARLPRIPPEQRHHARPDQQADRAGDGLANRRARHADLPRRAVHQPVLRAHRDGLPHGVISGYACGAGCLEFRPDANATRGQLSKMLYNAITNP